MSKVPSGTRKKPVREAYVEHLAYDHGLTPYMNAKRKPFTHLNSMDDSDIAYLSSPEYLRKMFQQDSTLSSESMIDRYIPRTKTEGEIQASRFNKNRPSSGNPKYKAQEDYYDEVQELKKEMKTLQAENSILRTKLRRLEEDNCRKRKEIDGLCGVNKDGDLGRTLTGSSTERNNSNNPNANNTLRLKQRIFKLETQLKDKEAVIEEMKNDPKWTRSRELEIQNRELLAELEKQRVLQQMKNLRINEYSTTVDEEIKKAVQKLNQEKDKYKLENESLKKKIREFETQKPLLITHENSNDDLKRKIDNLKKRLDQKESSLENMEEERNELRKRLDEANEKIKQLERDLKESRKPISPRQPSPRTMINRSPLHDSYDSSRTTPRKVQQSSRGHGLVSEKVSQNASRPTSPHTSSKHSIGESPRGDKKSTDLLSYSPGSRKSTNVLQSSSKPANANSDRINEFRQNHAARVIQQKYRTYNQSKKKPPNRTNELKNKDFEKDDDIYNRSPGRQSPYSSPKPGNFNSNRDRASSPASVPDSLSLKIVQASLKGHANRSELLKNLNDTSSPTPKLKSQSPSLTSKRRDNDNEDESEADDKLTSMGLSKKFNDKNNKQKPWSNPSQFSSKLSSQNDDNITSLRSRRQLFSNSNTPSKPGQSSSPPPSISQRPSSPLYDSTKPISSTNKPKTVFNQGLSSKSSLSSPPASERSVPHGKLTGKFPSPPTKKSITEDDDDDVMTGY